MIVPGKFVCGSFLFSVCMFIVSKALLIWSATVIVRAGGGVICLKPFSTVLFNEWSVFTVDYCVLYPCCVSVFGMFALSSPDVMLASFSLIRLANHVLISIYYVINTIVYE